MDSWFSSSRGLSSQPSSGVDVWAGLQPWYRCDGGAWRPPGLAARAGASVLLARVLSPVHPGVARASGGWEIRVGVGVFPRDSVPASLRRAAR